MLTEPRVLIDATAVPADRGGVGRYVDCLVAALEADGAAPMVVCQLRDAELYAALAPRAEVMPAMERLITRTARLTWEQTTLPWLSRRMRADVLHCPHYTMPLVGHVATVVTLHDATFFTDPDVHSSVKARFFRAWTRASLRLADVCVVPSVSTARELRRVVGTNAGHLQVVHHGVDSDRFHLPSPEEIAAGRAVRVPRRRHRGGLPLTRRGLRVAGAGGDGNRRRGADHPAPGVARGRRGRGGVLRHPSPGHRRRTG